MAPGQSIRGFYISKAVTTVQDNQRMWNVDGTTPEQSLVRLRDLLIETAETNADIDLVGKSSRWMKGMAEGYFATLLDEFTEAGYFQSGIDPNDGQRYDGWKPSSLVIEQYEDVFAVQAEVNFTTPVNFVLMTFWVIPPRDRL